MEVLRQNSQTIITILEVLLYDPLYSWAVSPAEAYNRQKEELDVTSVQYADDGSHLLVLFFINLEITFSFQKKVRTT